MMECFKEGRKEMFYLTTHSTHFIYGYLASESVLTPWVSVWCRKQIHRKKLLFKTGRKEGNVLFNDTLNTFYLWLYGVKHGKEPLR